MKNYFLSDSLVESIYEKSNLNKSLASVKRKHIQLLSFYYERSQLFLIPNSVVSSRIDISMGVLYLLANGWVMSYINTESVYSIDYMGNGAFKSITQVDENDKPFYDVRTAEYVRSVLLSDYVEDSNASEYVDRVISRESSSKEYIGCVFKNKSFIFVKVVEK